MDDLVGLVGHRVVLGPGPQVLPVVDVVAAPRRAVVDALHVQVPPARHLAEPGSFQQGLDLLHRGAGGDVEVAHEAGGEALRVQGLVGGVVQQPSAEVLSRPVHSSSLLLANRSYISTMNRLVFRVMGPSGRVPTRKTGSASTYW